MDSNWISVKDKLPEETEYVLVYGSNGVRIGERVDVRIGKIVETSFFSC